MRLIDADKLIEILPFDFSEAEALDIIDKMPTAYNLYIARHKLEEEYNAAFANWDTSGAYESYGEMEAYKNAIRIVDDVLRESPKSTTGEKMMDGNMTLIEVRLILEDMIGSDIISPEEDEAIRRAVLYLTRPLDAAVENGLNSDKKLKLRLIDLDKLMDHPWLRGQLSDNANKYFAYGWRSCKEWIECQQVIEVGL